MDEETNNHLKADAEKPDKDSGLDDSLLARPNAHLSWERSYLDSSDSSTFFSRLTEWIDSFQRNRGLILVGSLVFAIGIMIYWFVSTRHRVPSKVAGKPVPTYVLPKNLSTALCSSVMSEGALRGEFLKSKDPAVMLRVFDCLQFTKQFGMKVEFGNRFFGMDKRNYSNLIQLINGTSPVIDSKKTCDKNAPSEVCLTKLLTFRSKGFHQRVLNELKQYENSQGLFGATIQFLKAEIALSEGNIAIFKRSLIAAAQFVPKNLTGLRSELLIWGDIHLLHLGLWADAAYFANLNLKILEGEDTSITWVPRFLAQYSSAETRAKIVEHAFSKAGVIQLVKNPILLDFLVPDAVKMKNGATILGSLDLIRDFQLSEKHREGYGVERVILWKTRILLSLSRIIEAEKFLLSWVKNESKIDGETWYVRGLIAMRQGKYSEARTYLNTAAKYGYQGWTVQWNQGLVAAKLKKSSEAKGYAAAILKSPKGVKQEKEAWVQFLLAEDALARRDTAGGIAGVRRFLTLMPNNAAGFELLQKGLMQAGKRQEAVRAGLEVDKLRAQLQYYLTDRYLYAPNGPFSGVR